MDLTGRLVSWGGPTPKLENATRTFVERHGVLVVLCEEDQVVGLGEATPLPGYGGGALADARGELERVNWTELGALEPNELNRAIEARVPSARFAIETALLDRCARQRDAPIADLLAGRRVTRPVLRAPLAGLLGEPTTLACVQSQRARGAKAIKLKARGRELALESAALGRVREIMGPELEIRLDLNGALDRSQAHRALEIYAAHRVRWVEEPVSGKALLDLGTTAVPWLADESLAEPALAAELVACEDCAGVVLKPTILGLFAALELARKAAPKIAIVSHAFEGPIALAACAELALAISAVEACGIDHHDGLLGFPRASITQLLDASRLAIVPIDRRGHGIAWADLRWP